MFLVGVLGLVIGIRLVVWTTLCALLVIEISLLLHCLLKTCLNDPVGCSLNRSVPGHLFSVWWLGFVVGMVEGVQGASGMMSMTFWSCSLAKCQ